MSVNVKQQDGTLKPIAGQATGGYELPQGGIPLTDLSESVQESLSKADSALQTFTEEDPTVPDYVKNISEEDITNWNKSNIVELTKAEYDRLVADDAIDNSIVYFIKDWVKPGGGSGTAVVGKIIEKSPTPPTDPSVVLWVDETDDDAIDIGDIQKDIADINDRLDSLEIPTSSTKTAVILGDSYFDNRDAGITFGDWLEGEHIYKTVYNYAIGGTGFGYTYDYTVGCSLYELLISGTGTVPILNEVAYEELRNNIKKADIIYIHLGGNDVTSTVLANNTKETDLLNKIKACFNKLNELNPNATIYYTPFLNINLISIMNETGLYSKDVSILTTKLLYDIMLGVADNNANILVNSETSSHYIYNRIEDGLHPDIISSKLMYNNIVHGYYKNKKLNCFMAIFQNDMMSNEDIALMEYIISNNLINEKNITLWTIPYDDNQVYFNEVPCRAYSGKSYSAEITQVYENYIMIARIFIRKENSSYEVTFVPTMSIPTA